MLQRETWWQRSEFLSQTSRETLQVLGTHLQAGARAKPRQQLRADIVRGPGEGSLPRKCETAQVRHAGGDHGHHGLVNTVAGREGEAGELGRDEEAWGGMGEGKEGTRET